MPVHVNIDNFRAAETSRMFDDLGALSEGVNQWFHYRRPPSIENQPVIRMNRDTLYSAAIVDLEGGATLTLPDAAGRYMTAMVINADHYINRVFSEPGAHELTRGEFGSDFVNVTVRTFVDPGDPDDIAEVNRLQDQLTISAPASRPYTHPDYDVASLDATRDALLLLGQGVPGTDHMFGAKADVEPTRHLIGTALGWGGLPESEAYYYIDTEPREAGHYTFTLRDVPVDGFWSITIYNRDGYLEPNPYGAYNKNSVTSQPDPDGGITLNLAPEAGDLGNHLYVMDGWNYALRLYRPRPEVIDKTWVPPRPVPVG